MLASHSHSTSPHRYTHPCASSLALTLTLPALSQIFAFAILVDFPLPVHVQKSNKIKLNICIPQLGTEDETTTALYHAINARNGDMVMQLLDAKADPEQTCYLFVSSDLKGDAKNALEMSSPYQNQLRKAIE